MRIFQYSKLAKPSQFREKLSNKIHSNGNVYCSGDQLDTLGPSASHSWVLFYRPLSMYTLWNPSVEMSIPGNPSGHLDADSIFSYRLEPRLPLLQCCWRRSATVRAFTCVLDSPAETQGSLSGHISHPHTGITQKLCGD